MGGGEWVWIRGSRTWGGGGVVENLQQQYVLYYLVFSLFHCSWRSFLSVPLWVRLLWSRNIFLKYLKCKMQYAWYENIQTLKDKETIQIMSGWISWDSKTRILWYIKIYFTLNRFCFHDLSGVPFTGFPSTIFWRKYRNLVMEYRI